MPNRYTSIPEPGQVNIYMDDNERKDYIGKPSYNVLEWFILSIVHLIWAISLPVTWWCSFKMIPQYERALIYRLGRLQRAKGPGLIYVIPCIDRWKKVDMRMRAFNVPPQEVFTIDGGLLKIGSDVQYRIMDPMASFNELQDLNHTLRVTAVAALNNGLAGKKLAEIENEKNYLNAILQNNLNRTVFPWGLEIARFELTKSTILKSSKGGGDDFPADQDPLQSVLSALKAGFTSGANPFASALGAAPTVSHAPDPDLLTPSELFAMTKGFLSEEIVKKIDAVFEFDISGNNGGMWCLDLRNGQGYVGKGKAPCDPDVRIRIKDTDFQSMYYGRLPPTNAYMNGKMVIEGDIKAAMRLEDLIKCIKEQQVKS
ncbi:stomatin-like protein 1 isoform X2 [Rhopilema esculentum]|uniref:stomatin-like protein 1 isoform X2 n=1 Tax=Rhopilema esculentum TaxID=499914 RepID=UPI0031DC9F6A